MKSWWIRMGLTVLISCFGNLWASASLWPGLAVSAREKSGAFRTDDFLSGTATLKSPYLINHGDNAEYAGYVNAAIAREKEDFLANLKKSNETVKTLGWMAWHEGLIGNFLSNQEGITSIVLIEQTLKAGDAHGVTVAKGFNFNPAGELFTLSQLLPNLTVEDVNACIELTAKKKNISLLPVHKVTNLPTNFYVGKNRVIYAIYQQGELTSFSEGVFSVPIGRV